MKKKFLILGSAFLATSITFAAVALVTPETASAADYNTTTVTTVATVEGASVRILAADDEYKGLRFGAYVNSEWYQDGYEAGFLLYEGEASAPITHETVGAVECPSLVWQTATDYAVEGLDFYTAVIAGIDVSDNATVLTARAYVETAEGTYTYADTQVSSSVAEAASKALASGKYTQYETELNGYLEGVSWTVTVNGATQLVAHGQKAVAPATPTMEGYTFAGWTANGKAFDFATDVITLDTTVEATWTANYQTSFDFEEETVNMDLISNSGTGADSTFEVTTAEAKTGNQSLVYHNGAWEGNVYQYFRFTDETLSMIDENDGFRISLMVEKILSTASKFNVRIRPYNFNTNEYSNNWITHTNDYTNFGEWLTFDENGGFATPSAIMADIKAGGGIAVCVERSSDEQGGGKRTLNIYYDDIEFVKNVENTAAMNFENYAAGTVLAEKNVAKVSGWNMWNCGNSSLTVSNLQAKTGNKSLMLDHKDKWPSFDIPFAQGMIDALVPGTTAVELSVYVDKHLDTDMSMYVLHWYPASSDTKCVVYRYSSLVTVDLTGQWVTYTISDADTVEKVKTAGGLKLYFETGTADNSRLFIDDIKIIDVVNAQGYQNTEVTFPEGTTNNSTNGVEYTIDGATYNRWYGNGNFSVFSGEGTERYLMHETSTKGPLVRITLPTEKIAAAAGAKEFSFRIQFGKHSSTATSFNVRVFNKGYGAGEDAVKFTEDANTNNFATDVWIKISITDATAIAKILADGGFNLATEGNGHTSGSYRVYIDDIAFTFDDSAKVVSEDIAAYVAACVPTGAEVSEIVVKNAAGETVALTDGKITAEGEYVITAKIVENGVTKTFTMKVIV